MSSIRLLILLALALAAACKPLALKSTTVKYSDVGTFGTGGFFHEELPYHVAPLPGSDQLLGADWNVDNFYEKDGRWEPKQTAEYLDELHFDTDGDGKTDTRLRLPAMDLHFLHRRHSSEVWLSTVPLSSELAERDLRVLADQYVEAAAGGYATIRLGQRDDRERERRYSTRMVDSREVSVAGKPALEFTFEVANVDQLKLEQSSRARLVRVVLMRPGFSMQVDDSKYRVLMIFGHSAMPRDFDSTLDDFASLVSRVGFDPDAALDGATGEVLGCLGDRPLAKLALKITVSAEGKVDGAEVDPPEQLGKPQDEPLGGYSEAIRKKNAALRERIRETGECATQALSAVALPAAGQERKITWTFRRGAKARAREQHAPYVTRPVGAGKAGSAPAASAAPAPAAPAVAPASAATSEDGLRAKIDAARADLLACTGSERLPLELVYAGGKVQVKLTGELAGSAEEGCVRQVLGALPAPPGEGRLIHLVR